VKVGENTYLCSPKGNFRKSEDRDYRLPVIGDRVAVKLDKNEGVDGYITSIHARDNHLKRADAEGRRERIMAANLDRILVVSAVAKPGIDYPMLDRYLLSCRLERINCCFVINKVELDPEFDHFELDGYEEMGVPILYTSAKTGQGLDTLKEWVSEGISYLTGTSGVGKSTIINCLVPEADLATGSVDPRKGRGRHTTTNSTLVPIGGGYLVDSPGLRDFYPPKVPPEEVRFGFEEIVEVQSNCRFTSCLHDQEPGCAVFEAVEEGAISVDRYKSYLYLLGEMQAFALNKY
jgi:ribosome biogenesis GTPase